MYPEPTYRSCCGVYSSNQDHICVKYDGPACNICGAGTVSCEAGAPGYGRVDICKNNHHSNSTVRVFSPSEVV